MPVLCFVIRVGVKEVVLRCEHINTRVKMRCREEQLSMAFYVLRTCRYYNRNTYITEESMTFRININRICVLRCVEVNSLFLFFFFFRSLILGISFGFLEVIDLDTY